MSPKNIGYWIKIANDWLKENEVFSNLVGIFAVTTITILFTLLPFHPAQKGLRLAKDSNTIANDSNVIAKRSNVIAEKSRQTAEEVAAFTKKRVFSSIYARC